MTEPKKHSARNCYNLVWVVEVWSDEEQLWLPKMVEGDEGNALKERYEFFKMLREAGLDSRTRISTFRRTYD